jgi:hypothetical protein
MPEQSIQERLAALLDRQDDEAERALQLLYGELPALFPLPRLEHARRIVYQLGNDGFTAEQIAKFATDSMADNWMVPGTVENSGAFIRAVNELAHIKYALTLPGMEGLKMLAGELAAFGFPFKNNSIKKPRAPSPPRKAIARELAKNPALWPRQLWAILAKKHPKGWDFDGEGREGRIWITGRAPMGYARFSEVCKEEKDKLTP